MSSPPPRAAVVLGTRGSALARAQTGHVAGLLQAAWPGLACEARPIVTRGDRTQASGEPLPEIGGKGLFTAELEQALRDGEIDLAVHSLKDLPTLLPEGIALAAVSEREDPSDALVGRGPVRWTELPKNGTVATSSLRRKAQLLHARPDLRVTDLRGNVDTRLRKLDASDWSAILLAAAGLLRLGLGHRIGERLPSEVMLPAPGQGALAVTARVNDRRAIEAARSAVHHRPSALAVAAERAFLRRMEGGCQVPVGARAVLEAGDTLMLHARVIALDGSRMAEGHETGTVRGPADAERIGTLLADRLMGEGAAEILAEVRAGTVPSVPEP